MFWRLIVIGLLMGLAPSSVQAHDWYSKRRDPVTLKPCCGGTDCAQLVILPGVLTPVAEGYHIKLTAMQASVINPDRVDPIDIIVPWSRVQDSEDGNYHLCIPSGSGYTYGEFFCFFAPPNT